MHGKPERIRSENFSVCYVSFWLIVKHVDSSHSILQVPIFSANPFIFFIEISPGHREGEHHTPGLFRSWGTGRGIALGEKPNVDDGLMGAANHHGTCIPM